MSKRKRKRLHRPELQPEFPGMVTIKPPRKPEPDVIYLAVLTLRTEGHSVFRAGPSRHVIDGVDVIDSPELIKRGGTEWILLSSKAPTAAKASPSAT